MLPTLSAVARGHRHAMVLLFASMAIDNLTLVRSAYEAFARGDVPVLLAAMSADIRWQPAENSPYDRGTPYIGPQEILKNIFQPLTAEWDRFSVTPERYLQAGDSVIVELRYGGTYRATGRSTRAQAVHIWTVRDGKLAEFRQYVDTAEMRDAMRSTDPQARPASA